MGNAATEARSGGRTLDTIQRVGDVAPHPAVIFLLLSLIVIGVHSDPGRRSRWADGCG
jgi:p-aminobenzoyl-glutamate transporter AbgT